MRWWNCNSLKPVDEDLGALLHEKRILKEVLFVIENDHANLEGWSVLCNSRSHSFKRFKWLKQKLPKHTIKRLATDDGHILIRIYPLVTYHSI